MRVEVSTGVAFLLYLTWSRYLVILDAAERYSSEKYNGFPSDKGSVFQNETYKGYRRFNR